MTASNSAGWKRSPYISRSVLFIAAIYFIPTLLPSLFGWLLGVLAVPIAYVLTVEGYEQGIITLRNSLLIAGAGALLTGRLDLFLFTLTLVPLGYSLYSCGRANRNEAVTGGYGVLILGISWFIFWTIYGMFTGIQPYQHLVNLLDAGFVQTYELYRTNADLPAEMQAKLASVIAELRELIPRILPGILCCSVLVTVWMNQVVLNSLLRRRHPETTTRPPYSYWKLPEQLVWIPIAATVLFLLSDNRLKDLGLNVLLISGVVYFFQGLAVFIHLLGRWKVPPYLRILLYVMLVIQSYGLVLITLLGIGETWMNIRPEKENEPPEQGPQSERDM
ncbi:MAG TPA: DUF2232 domain-containing protein [Desulfobulbus sp.]|nr:DUF2232 domain-containing protein [Desulfobulbus sp.]